MSDLIDRDGYRANVGIVLMHADGQLFLGRRSGGRGWQFPQGGMRRGEVAEESLYRELHEEVGLTAADVQLLGETRRWLRYRLPRRYLRHGQMPLCVGQKQRWFLLQLRSADSAIRFDRTDQPPEFDRWRWVDFWQPVREVIYFKRPVYTRALHELGAAYPGGLPAYPLWWHQPEPTDAAAAEPAA